MSDVGDLHQPCEENDLNGSIIQKVRSKVSKILPEKLSSWFSPTSKEDDLNRNGTLRRRRDEDDYTTNNRDTDESNSEDERNHELIPPPKRTKLNLDVNFSNRLGQVQRNFLASTPYISDSNKFINRNNISSPETLINISHGNLQPCRGIIEEDNPDIDVLEVIPEHHSLRWDYDRQSASRRSLNIPSSTTISSRRRLDPRQLSLRNVRSTMSSKRYVDDTVEQNEDDEVETTDITSRDIDKNRFINGVPPSPNTFLVDTASESGDSLNCSVQGRKVSGLYGPDTKRMRKSAGSVLNFATHLQGEKSLFSDKNNISSAFNNSTTSLTSLNRRQSFNASLYGSTSALSDSRLLNTSSPFYKGRTTYGGASAYSKYGNNAQRVIRTPTLIRPSSSLSSLPSSTNSLNQIPENSSALSSTAKRILELMNTFTTPLADVKKMATGNKIPGLISNKKRFGDEDLANARAIRMNMPKTPYSRPNLFQNKNSGPPISNLQVPSMSQLLQMKKLQNHTEKVREIASSSQSILNQEEEYKLPDNNKNTKDSNKYTGKIKNKINRTRKSINSIDADDDNISDINLPNITLPVMNSIPKIDIPLSKPPTHAAFSSTVTSEKTENEEKNIAKDNSSNETNKNNFTSSSANESFKINVSETENSTFKFSSPLYISEDSNKVTESSSLFKFRNPAPVKNSLKISDQQNFCIKPNMDVKLKTKNDSLTVPALKTSGSVLDILKPSIIQEEPTEKDKDFGNKLNSNKWECSVCMLKNDINKEKCVACQNQQPKIINQNLISSKTKPQINENKNLFDNKFLSSAKLWDCPTCLIQNKEEINKCVACETLRPGGVTLNKNLDPDFQQILTEQSKKWECSTCMTFNEQTRNKCISCEQTKPGLNTDSTPSFSFGTSKNKYTFGFVNKNAENKFDNIQSSSDEKSDRKNDAKTTSMGNFKFGFDNNVISTGKLDTIKTNTERENLIINSNIDTVDRPSTNINITTNTNEIKNLNTNVSDTKAISQTELNQTKNEFIPSSKEETKSNEQTSNNENKISIFNPIGTLAFSGKTTSPLDNNENKENSIQSIFDANTTKFSTSNPFLNSKPTFGISPIITKNNEINPSIAAQSTNVSENNMMFGRSKDVDKKDVNKFPFGIPKTTSLTMVNTTTTTTPSTILSQTSPQNKSFIFGSTSTNNLSLAKPTFGTLVTTATSSNTIFGTLVTTTASSNTIFGSSLTTTTTSLIVAQTTTTTTAIPSFASIASTVSSTTAFGSSLRSNIGSTTTTTTTTTASFINPITQTPQNNLTFGTFGVSQPSTTTSNNLFTFGATKTNNNNPGLVFGNVSSTTNKPFSLNVNDNKSTISPFLFGDKSSNNPTTTAITTTTTAATFGSFSSTLSTTQHNNTTFGQTTAIVSPFANIGNNNVPTFGTTQSAIPLFGSAAPVFNNTTTPSFGTSNNATFGNNNTQSTPFGSAFMSGSQQQVSPPKKPSFSFENSPHITNSTGGFPFGNNNANNNTNDGRQPFTFNANATPSFNFTANQEATSSSQVFQFGETPSNNTNFGFNATERASNAPFDMNTTVVANNPFAPTPSTTTALQPRRKFRQGIRRMTPRIMSAKNLPRRQAIPILYTRGGHYDIGFDMGRTFGSLIKNFLQLSEPLNDSYLPLYMTEKGKEVYNDTLESVKKSFPQYIRELEGIADGAQVEFHKLFLLHMDEITPKSLEHSNNVITQPIGCSTICVNKENCQILAHTEDALTETLNHYYFVVAHVINDAPQGKYNVKEERFMSLCYAGHLPGYTMNYNHHGLVFSINTLSAEYLQSGKTPRHFLTRALLSAENFEQAETILRDAEVGVADGCSINMTFLKSKEPRIFYNIEIAPSAYGTNESQMDIKFIKPGEINYHCNKYLRLPIKEANPLMIDSSISRMNVFYSFECPKTKGDLIMMLGDESEPPHTVFRENGKMDEEVKTIAVGIFDCLEKTLTLYSDNPKFNEPQVVIPLVLKN